MDDCEAVDCERVERVDESTGRNGCEYPLSSFSSLPRCVGFSEAECAAAEVGRLEWLCVDGWCEWCCCCCLTSGYSCGS